MYKIRYFSATNNSKYYAYSLYEEMKKEIDDVSYEFIDINGEEFKDDVLILFFPILFQRMPISLNTFISNSKFENTLIYVYAGSFDKLGMALIDLKNALKEKDATLASFKMIKVPNNNIIKLWGKATGEFSASIILDKGRNEVLKDIEKIKNKEKDDVNKIKIKYRKNKYTKISYKKYEEEIAKLGDHFMINSECIRCRMCQMDCVRENIDLIDGIITFKDKCEGCLACINNCPYGAIEYEDITRGRRRYKNPKEINE